MKDELIEYCQMLTDTMQWHEIGFFYWPHVKKQDFEPEDESHCGICTNGARLIALKFNGKVYGYPITRTDPTQLVGSDCGGHDFVVIDDYVIDWWGWEYSKQLVSPVNLIQDVEGKEYKKKESWIELPNVLSLLPLDTTNNQL